MAATGRETVEEVLPAERSAGTMRAAVFTGSEGIRTEEVERPEPGPGEVRVRLEGCGLCASNLPVWEGRPWFDYPRAPGSPGHEAWGRIDALGEGVTHLEKGARVAVLSYHAFAQYDVAAASTVVPLPPALDGQPFPAEPLACALNVFRRSDIRPGQTVAIIGIGFLGALLTGLAADAGARVLALSRRSYALAVARQFGAAETIPLEDHEAIAEQVKDRTDGEGCDRVIEAVGKQGPLDLAGALTRVRGRLIIAGYHQDGQRQVDMQLWNWRGLDVINAHERDPEVYVRGMREAVAAVAEGRLDPAPLYTHTFGLENLREAMETARARPDGFMKAIITTEA